MEFRKIIIDGKEYYEAIETDCFDEKTVGEDAAKKSKTQAVIDDARELGSKIGDGAKAAAEKISDKAKNIGEKLKDSVGELGNAVKDDAKDFCRGAKELGCKVADKAKDIGAKTADAAKDVGAKVKDKAKDIGARLGEEAKEAGAQAKDEAKDFCEGAKDFGVKVADKAKVIGTKTAEVAKTVGERVANEMRDAGHKIKEGAERLFAKDKTLDPDSKEAKLIKLLPYMNRKDTHEVAELLLEHDTALSGVDLSVIMPFVSGEDCNAIFLRCIELGRNDLDLAVIMQFVDSSVLTNVVDGYLEGKYPKLNIDSLYPFLSDSDIKRIFKQIIGE